VKANLSDRLTRIRLLAWSYLDALEPGKDSTTADNVDSGGTGSRAPSRNHELWTTGSYWQLERAMDALPPYARIRFWVFYVRAGGPFKHEHKPHPVLGRVERLMPRDVFVPAEVSEAAGFLRSDAEKYSRG
jgi:hypothetical protein